MMGCFMAGNQEIVISCKFNTNNQHRTKTNWDIHGVTWIYPLVIKHGNFPLLGLTPGGFSCGELIVDHLPREIIGFRHRTVMLVYSRLIVYII